MYDFEKVFASKRRREHYDLPLMTSRGCPHGCTYCSVTRMFGRKVRRQSVERVRDDLRHFVGQGYRRFYRWGGLSPRRIRSFMRQRTFLVDKLAMLWANARTARRTMRDWRRDTREFLRTVAARRYHESADQPWSVGVRT
jgi:hypothetical protein